MPFKNYLKFLISVLGLIFITQCGIYKKVDSRNVPINAQERARKNVNEGSGISLKGLVGNRGNNF